VEVVHGTAGGTDATGHALVLAHAEAPVACQASWPADGHVLRIPLDPAARVAIPGGPAAVEIDVVTCRAITVLPA
jgi:hypothetical protein